MVARHKPEAAIMENVTGVMRVDEGRAMDDGSISPSNKTIIEKDFNHLGIRDQCQGDGCE